MQGEDLDLDEEGIEEDADATPALDSLPEVDEMEEEVRDRARSWQHFVRCKQVQCLALGFQEADPVRICESKLNQRILR